MADDIEKEYSPHPPPRTRRNTGWSDESSKFQRSRNLSLATELDSVKSPERLTIIDSDDDIPIIPDLDDIQEENTSRMISDTSVAIAQVAKYKETETDVLKHSAFSGYEHGMLRLLTKGMNAEADIKEEDTSLTLQQLFANLSSGSP